LSAGQDFYGVRRDAATFIFGQFICDSRVLQSAVDASNGNPPYRSTRCSLALLCSPVRCCVCSKRCSSRNCHSIGGSGGRAPVPASIRWPRGSPSTKNSSGSAFLCFAGLLYPSYDVLPRSFGLSALNDQVAAGCLGRLHAGLRINGLPDSGGGHCRARSKLG
jgi:hypothetical protein